MNSSDPNLCDECEEFTELFEFVNPCVTVETPVPNCTEYTSGACTACHNDFILVDGACTVRPALEGNCKIKTADVCTECVDGYELVVDKCIGIESYNYQNCLETSGSGSSTQCE